MKNKKRESWGTRIGFLMAAAGSAVGRRAELAAVGSSSLSMGLMSGFTIFGVKVFDFFDILTDKIFLAIGGMLLAIINSSLDIVTSTPFNLKFYQM